MVAKTLRKKMWRDLWHLRAQAVSIAILIVSGVSLLVATWSAYESLRGSRDAYYQDFHFADVFSEFKRAPPDALRKIESVPGVELVHPRVSGEGLVSVSAESEPAVGRFLSVPGFGQPPLNKVFLRGGRLPADTGETEVVAHEGFALAHRLALGSTIELLLNGRKERARVVGIGISPEYVYALSPATPLPDDLHFGVFWMTERKLQRLMGLEDSFNSVAIRAARHASREAILSAVDRILSAYGSLGAYGRDRQVSNMFVEDEIAQQRSSAIFIPAIFLAIATFLINVVSTRLVTLHRSQIAVLKSVGYTRWEVARHYLWLLVLMTFVGTLPGIALGGLLGKWMSKTYESYFRFPDLDFSMSAGAAAIGLIAGILPGLLGAWIGIRAAFRLSPAEAMRPPAPPAFHGSLLERAGFFGRVGVRLKMTLRNLFSRPFRLALVIVSLSAATGVLVAAGAWADIFDFLLDSHFNRLMREDLSITFVRPRPSGAIQEISGLPGVVAVEGYRVVPVRVRFRNHKRELALTGWPAHSAMRQRLDLSLRTVPLPGNGVLLSRFFEKSWGLKAGDSVEIEPLEGRARRTSVPVAGFTDDLVGLSASVEIDRLWRLMNENPAYNLATVKADPRMLSNLYVRLKSYPEVSSVVLKTALHKGFSSSFGQVIRSTTNVLMIASLFIALGIIYNSVRVSFSERSWELASLRVLGFSRTQVSDLLLSEVGIQILLSLIPGCILGLALTHLSLNLIHTETFGFPVIIDRATYARGVLVVILAFLASAKIVQAMVQRLSPAEALKSRE